ncbi:MAG: diaminopimelate decarboxylase [Paludibacter sp.]|nr:diaminopimelate decarboxylase [Bacteroidales bacterium]MCM1069599.1 diaminopimelate decarboxylase [Prevotella sp.]MCM1354245.1 diaminopimelate decarboxylase [Bacteroides sp.]MCM1443084.1 diaminopimelate decarboxylase [Muribaculum sp.]MCM1482319.1 diaminopimelate decarboxylase [Paludibacter sp.]
MASSYKTVFPLSCLIAQDTPVYYYDMELLRHTIRAAQKAVGDSPFCVHYALKACFAEEVLTEIAQSGWGADCVSGGEVRAALAVGIPADRIVFAGVAKADWEIRYALEQGIFCFNVESLPELEVINEWALRLHTRARVALRVNPNVDAHTHKLITTGLQENKFGIQWEDVPTVIEQCRHLEALELIGLHFHIGSQITDMKPFVELCSRINALLDRLQQEGIVLPYINVGGGLGIDYVHPEEHPIADFDKYFAVFKQHLHLKSNQTVHFELGRSIVGQCGSLLTRVLYVKQGIEKQFAMLDAGMTDLIRPALYGALHKIENLSSPNGNEEIYDVVGPVCESSDVFAEHYALPRIQRGDLLAIRSTGAYGESMASCYNLRRLPGHITSDNCL